MEKYKNMWEELKQSILADKEFYDKGVMCSLAEAIHGSSNCKEMLKTMEKIEQKYKEE